MPWVFTPAPERPLDRDRWQLFDLDEDFSQGKDFAAGSPQELAQMRVLFDREAERNHVYPLIGGADQRAANPPASLEGRTHFVFHPGVVRLPEGVVPNITLRSHTVTADIGPVTGNAIRTGMLITQGGGFGGYGLYVTVVTSSTLTANAGPGAAANGLYIDDQLSAQTTVPKTPVWRLSLHETLDVGEDSGSPVDDSYSIPFRFSGDLRRVTVDLQ